MREVEKRLEKGAREYGDSSMERDTDDLLVEIQEELADVTGWSFILWRKIELLRYRV